MAKVIQIAANALIAKITTDDREAKLAVSNLLSYAVEGAEFSKAFSSGSWTGRSTFFSMIKGTFPAGFLFMVHNHLTKLGYTVQLARRPLPAPLGPEDPIVDEFGNDDPRYGYQMETVHRLLKYGRMIAQIATGGGKSKIALLCTARLARPTLFVTTRGVLMHQMRKAYRKAKIPCGIIGDSEWAPIEGGVNVAMIQTLVARLEDATPDSKAAEILNRQNNREEKEVEELKLKLKKAKIPLPRIHSEVAKLRKAQEERSLTLEQITAMATEAAEKQQAIRAKTIAFLKTVELVIGEEAHEAGGNSYYDVLSHCPSAHYRLALTATPFMRDDAESNMRLHAAFGPVAIKVSEKLLIDRGILARPYFKFVDLPKPAKLYKSTDWARAYKIGIVENDLRNKRAVAEVARAARRGLTSMILVQRKDHGAVLVKMLAALKVRARFIRGESSQEEREAALAALGRGELDVLIGTTILDVGVDVPSVFMIVLLGGGKAEVALRQRIGRGLRAKRGMANVSFILDFIDKDNSHLRDHAKQRRFIIENTPGFVEGILPAGEDFPWGLVDQVRAAA